MEQRNEARFRRFCKTMELRDDPTLIESYKKVHQKGAAWNEITQGMKEVGILDMEIYLLGTQLFMIMDTVEGFDHDHAMAELSKKPRQSEWERYVAQFQATGTEATADQKWHLMEQIYKME
ncbi:L-rhamnose mutarotase [Dyadobacter pollutisoli]|uniref:L-rhamnose mutarotase n=1 Tax=Dyadobacter pollutisoli TaxID=2910158 RepID=A0A9E8SLE4_9BACT|nr:L-rhamnose mutarotase [Dyadobacter pollutisoli]WAC13500.1 L-rhamnose mutarotase [Dyadobacter pollutisoli]